MFRFTKWLPRIEEDGTHLDGNLSGWQEHLLSLSVATEVRRNRSGQVALFVDAEEVIENE